jgi:hypothetical protein
MIDMEYTVKQLERDFNNIIIRLNALDARLSAAEMRVYELTGSKMQAKPAMKGNILYKDSK